MNASSRKKEQTAELTSETRDRFRNQAEFWGGGLEPSEWLE